MRRLFVSIHRLTTRANVWSEIEYASWLAKLEPRLKLSEQIPETAHTLTTVQGLSRSPSTISC